MLPKRKPNRLRGWDYRQNGAYFVTICTQDRKCLLATIVGGDAHIAPQTCLSSYGAVVETYIRRVSGIDKYVIIPNHIHMIIRIDGPMWASALRKGYYKP